MKAMSLIKILGTAASVAAGLSAVSGVAGKGAGLLSGATSLLSVAAGGKGKGAGGGGGRATGSGILSAISGLGAKGTGRGSGGAGKGSGKARRQAQDVQPAARTVLDEDAAYAVTEAEGIQAQQETAEDMPVEHAEAVRFLESCIVSSTQGRVRLRNRIFEGSPALEEMRLAATGVPGVQTAEASPRTGSLLATWDEGAASLARILGAMADVPAVRAAATGG
ncbi:MAG: hypothetical protein K6E40_02810 [Desulfovibrio sp.]|nr:hypothetical protein [Desulfovibrio sp.]